MRKTKVYSVKSEVLHFETRYDFKIVTYSVIKSETDYKYNMLNVVVAVYERGELIASSAYRPLGTISVSKRTMKPGPSTNVRIESLRNDAIQKAIRVVLSRGQRFNATVLYWDNNRSEGLVEVHGVGKIDIYGCNAYNALTGFNETACISLSKGQVIGCKLANMGTHLTVTDYVGNFDQAKSDSLNHNVLAFKRSNGKFVSGLF